MTDKVNPLVHLNGTGRAALMAEYKAAYDAVANASTAVANLTVHGRDYYPLDGGKIMGDAYQTARAEHEAHLAQLADMGDRLAEIYLDLDRQGQ